MFGTILWLCVFLYKTAIGLNDWGTVKPLNITEIMIRNEVIPQIIPECFPVFCYVFYTTRNFSISYRRSYRTTVLKKVPIIKWDCDSNKLYTLIFSNLDHANDTHIWVYQIHWWLVVNIADCDLQKGEEIFPYKSPKMWPEYGIYKQLFLIYEQTQPITVELAKNADNDTIVRHNFTIREFTNQYKFGRPIAGNFFRLGVPIIPLTTIRISNSLVV